MMMSWMTQYKEPGSVGSAKYDNYDCNNEDRACNYSDDDDDDEILQSSEPGKVGNADDDDNDDDELDDLVFRAWEGWQR